MTRSIFDKCALDSVEDTWGKTSNIHMEQNPLSIVAYIGGDLNDDPAEEIERLIVYH